MDIEQIKKDIEKLKRDVDALEQRRVTQTSFVPDCVKSRAMGEGNRFVKAGLEAKRPDGAEVTDSVTAYFAINTKKWWCWTGTAWVSTTLS